MKLFSIVNTFEKKQWVTFLTYIELYHNPKSAICQVAVWLDKNSFWKKHRQSDISAERLLSDFPHKIRLQSFLNALATLGNLAEEYVGWMVWKISLEQKKSCQLIGLAQKSLREEFLKTQNDVLTSSENREISIWGEHYKMVSLFHDYYFAISSSDDNYTDEFDNLIFAFRKSTSTIAQFLLVEIRNREKLLSESWKDHEEFFKLLYQNDTELRHITDQLIRMNYKGEIGAYNYLLDILLSKNIDRFSLNVQYCIVSYCINFLTGIIKEGAVHRGQELLDLYEFSLKKGIYTLNDSMPLKKFINIIGLASKLEKYDWARKIVDNWAHKVDKYNIKSIEEFGHATIDLHQRKYESVIQTISQLKSSNFQHKLRSRWLLLRAHYELNSEYVDVMKVHIDNFRRFIVSNETRINKSSFEGLRSSVKILNLILDRKPIIQIEECYNSCIFVYERKWIVEKIKNLVR